MELAGSRQLVGPDMQLWREVSFVGARPWFLAAFASRAAGVTAQWVCVAWDEALVARLQGQEATPLLKLICVGRIPGDGCELSVRSVQEIHCGQVRGVDTYVFRDVEGREFCADVEGTPASKVQGRRFIARIDASGSQGRGHIER